MTSVQETPATGPAGKTVPSARRKGANSSDRTKNLLTRIVGIIVTLVFWHLFAIGPGQNVDLPTPGAVWDQLVVLGETAQYWQSIGNTMTTTVVGLALSIAIAVPLGLLNGSDRRITMSSQFVVDFMRTVPPIAILPLLLLVLGGTSSMSLVLIMLGAVWPLVIQSTYAMQQVSSQLKMVGAAFHLTLWERIRSIYVPSALPFLMTGIRIASVISLLMSVAGEFFGNVDGVGRDLYGTLSNSDSVTMFVYASTAALLGMVLNIAIGLIQKRVLWWHPSVRGSH